MNINKKEYAARFMVWQKQVSKFRNAYQLKFNYFTNQSGGVAFRDYRVNWAWEAYRAGYKQAMKDMGKDK